MKRCRNAQSDLPPNIGLQPTTARRIMRPSRLKPRRYADNTKSEMSTPVQVETFYGRIWNRGDLEAASALLTDAFVFRGSLGAELQGRNEFLAYVRSVRSALADYHCEILECVTEGDRAFAQMRFSGRHVEVFRGFPPTGQPVHWLGAALFRFEGPAIAQLWVLGDLLGLEAMLKANQAA